MNSSRSLRSVLCAGVGAGVLFALLASPARPEASLPRTDRAALRALADRLARGLAAHRPARYYELLAAPGGAQQALNEDPRVRLMYVNEHGHPIFYVTSSLKAAQDIFTDDVWPSSGWGFNLDGSTQSPGELGVWDNGSPRLTHQEFGGRVSWADTASASVMTHATLVAGIMVSSGVNPIAKGMSPAGKLSAYDFNSDQPEMATAAANGMHISNHSYNVGAGWFLSGSTWYWYGDMTVSLTEDYNFGAYDSLSMAVDQIAVNAPTYTMVFGAANEHGVGPAPNTVHFHVDSTSGNWVQATDFHEIDGGSDGYDCLGLLSTPKNVIAVAAVQDLSDSGAWYAQIEPASSWGPTDDGRIKPDLSANGTTVTSADGSADNAYGTGSGTSMASPSVAGSVNLVVEYYKRSHGGAVPLSSTVKALLVETAQEVGPNLGPDYVFGWGMMNTLGAALLIQADSAGTAAIVEETLQDGETHVYWFQKQGSGDPLFTLTWTDPPGSPPGAVLNPTTPMLVNDLDLRIYNEEFPSYGPYLPWVLDPSNPSNSATYGDNVRDNVEQVRVDPAVGQWYRLEVSHKGTLASAQAYSLVGTEHLYRAALFADVTASALPSGADGGETAWADYDGDQDDDFFLLAGSGSLSRLLRDDGTAFAVADSAFLNEQGVVWGDYDNDGDADYYVLRGANQENSLYRNDGGLFVEETNNPPVSPWWENSSIDADWADYDGDGDLDLFVVNSDRQNRLFRNDATAGFADVTAAPLTADLRAEAGAAWVDFDLDGDPDLFHLKFYFPGDAWGGKNKLYRNDGGTFVDVATDPLQSAYAAGMAWADFDNDGDPDLSLRGSSGGVWLLRNDGGGNFSTPTPGAFPGSDPIGGLAWGDADNDGALDLLVSATTAGDPSRLLRNLGGGAFEDITQFALASPSTEGGEVTWVDSDDDGDLDFYQVNAAGPNRLMRNELASGNSWLKVRLRGGAGGSGIARSGGGLGNASAIGARVRVVTGTLAQVRTMSTNATDGQGPLVAHFGLGSASVVDTLQVSWPGSGTVETFVGLAPNRTIQVIEGQGATGAPIVAASETGAFRLDPSFPNPFRSSTALRFELPEPAPVRLRVLDVRGRVVATLLNEPLRAAGQHTVRWDGRDERGRRVAAGVYFFRLETQGAAAARRAILLH